MDDRHFEKALEAVLRHEGGYVNDPKDKGGETKFGISKRAYPYLNIKALTKTDAARIYKADYWDRGRYGMIDDFLIAGRCFDLGVNCGVSRSIKFLQRAYNTVRYGYGYNFLGLSVDGIMGQKTAAAVNGYKSQCALYEALVGIARDYYRSLNQPRFLNGWMNRLNYINGVIIHEL